MGNSAIDHTYFLLLLLVIAGLMLPLLVLLMRTLKRILPYLYVVARVRAKEAKLLKYEIIEKMINTESIAEIASILENSEYSLAMQGLLIENAESIEMLLIRQTADIYSEIAGMLPGKERRVFGYLRQQWDVRNLKTTFRGLYSEQPSEQIISRLVPFGELDILLLRKMAAANNFENALSLLEVTRYNLLATQMPANNKKGLLYLEAMLDKILLEEIWRSISAERGFQDLRSSFATRIDAINYKILLRAKRDRLLLTDVQCYLIAGGDMLPMLLGLFDESDDINALITEVVTGPFYKVLIEVLSEFDRTGSLFPLEKRLEEVVLAAYKQEAIKQPFGIAPILGYLSEKDIEICNIRIIARAKEAGLPIQRIRELVLKPV
jgi:V/A-type H+/Na+-transporting ATPase subunit C